MVKKLALLLAVLMVFGGVAFADAIKISLDGKLLEAEVAPIMEDNRTLVPLRVVSEGLGHEVGFLEIDGKKTIYVGEDKDTKVSVVDGKFVVKGDGVYAFIIGEKAIYKLEFDDDKLEEKEKKELDVAPKILAGRTMVPIRAISEALDLKVGWDKDTKTVILNSNDDDDDNDDALEVELDDDDDKDDDKDDDNDDALEVELDDDDDKDDDKDDDND